MNTLKHMEVIFGAVMVVGVVIAAMPERQATPAQPAAQAAPPRMQVVVIKGKRMTDVEKRASLNAEARPETNGS
ncbi:MAG: hypothetical protein V4693_22755 [Pseudomonadota bacterium]